MKIEDFNALLEELTHDDITTERQLEIFGSLRNDKETSIANYNQLLENSEKIKNDYDSLRKKSVEDFFNVGISSENAKKEFNNTQNEPNEGQMNIDDLIAD